MRVLGKVLGAAAFAPVLGCTPLGQWVYTDPAVTVAGVRVGTDTLSTPPVLVALDVQNPNDYPLSTIRVELSLQLDDLAVGELSQDSTVTLPKEATSTVALTLRVAAGVPAGRLVALGGGTHHFVVDGHAEITTPFGTRKIRFAQEGDLKFGPSSSSASAPTLQVGDGAGSQPVRPPPRARSSPSPRATPTESAPAAAPGHRAA